MNDKKGESSRMKYAHHTTSQKILEMITGKRLKPGERLPSIKEMADMFESSIQTCQDSVHELCAQGILESKVGSGVFIKSLTPHIGPGKKVVMIHPGSKEYVSKGSYPAHVIDPFCRIIQKEGWDLVPLPEKEWGKDLIETLKSLDPAAIVLFEIDNSLIVEKLKQLRRLMISIDTDYYSIGISSVIIDQEYGIFQTTKHLLEKGHTEIVFLRWLISHVMGGQEYLDPIEEKRITGYRLAMLQAGLKPRIDESPRGGMNLKTMVKEMLARPPIPTALVCQADWAVTHVASAVMECGFQIPEDISITGFGNTGYEIKPGIRTASVKTDYAEIGKAAARLFFREVQGTNKASRIIVPAEFVPAGSAAEVCMKADIY
jgi:DNA-binding LacI/PurR family transcriptional regulator